MGEVPLDELGNATRLRFDTYLPQGYRLERLAQTLHSFGVEVRLEGLVAKPGPISDVAESLSLDFNANAETADALLSSDYRTNEAIEDIVIFPSTPWEEKGSYNPSFAVPNPSPWDTTLGNRVARRSWLTHSELLERSLAIRAPRARRKKSTRWLYRAQGTTRSRSD